MTTNPDIIATTTDANTASDAATTPSVEQQTNEAESKVTHLSSIPIARTQWIVLPLILLVLVGLVAIGMTLMPNLRQPFNATTTDANALLTQEMLRIGDELQCPVCAGQSVAYSNSQLAAEMRVQIMEQLRAGADEATIKQYFVDRYGEVVLREPLRTGLNLWLWRMPVLGLFAGLAILGWMLMQTNRNRRLKLAEAGPHVGNQVGDMDPEVQTLLTQYDKELFE